MQETLEYVNCDLCGDSKTTLIFIKDSFKHVRCNSCGLIYVNPRLKNSKETLDSFYASNTNSEGLIKSLLDRDYSVKRQKIFYAELKKMERYRKLNRILDIGCSFGGFLNASKNRGWDVNGIEAVYEVGKYGKELYGLDIFFGTLDEAQLKPSSFDVIRLNNVIEHIHFPTEFLLKVSVLLRKGGLLIVSTTNYGSFSVLICGKDWIYFDGQHHIYLFTPATLKKLLDKNGFTTILLNTKRIHVRIKDNISHNMVKEILFKLSEKIISQFIQFTKKGHRLRVWAEKR
ncbi:MAG: class I SAM-dependent methyltransferase [Candidatus Scalindua sediminis]|nr:class I SAM-dependent methyltransferase [Candidatus Scalindua sediminis]HDY67170.1 class I SAM-dependent methyltransferase [Candidatus Scalindua sp.]